MCGDTDPTQYDRPFRPFCEHPIWLRGAMRPCGMEFGVTTWTDVAGGEHTACGQHRAEMRSRWPQRLQVPA